MHKDADQNCYLEHMLRGIENFYSFSLSRWKFLAGNEKKKNMSRFWAGQLRISQRNEYLDLLNNDFNI